MSLLEGAQRRGKRRHSGRFQGANSLVSLSEGHCSYFACARFRFYSAWIPVAFSVRFVLLKLIVEQLWLLFISGIFTEFSY